MDTTQSTHNVHVREEVKNFLGWPTDTVSVDYNVTENSTWHQKRPHTIIVFIPGNPGCIGWYIPNLVDLVSALGPGFAARGVSYAGHSPNEEITQVDKMADSQGLDRTIPYTVDGQILHKCAFMDHILSEFQEESEICNGKQHIRKEPVNFIFMSHSIGGHMVERLLMLREDILQRTKAVLHLMPFIRMHALPMEKFQLDNIAANPETVEAIVQAQMKFLRFLPLSVVDHLTKGIFEDKAGRHLTTSMIRQPWFGKNFFELGTEEIRDVPEKFDIPSLQLIAKQCPIYMFYCGKDHWAPKFHITELKMLQSKGVLPQNIFISYNPELRHAYVSRDSWVPTVIEWCLHHLRPHSRL